MLGKFHVIQKSKEALEIILLHCELDIFLSLVLFYSVCTYYMGSLVTQKIHGQKTKYRRLTSLNQITNEVISQWYFVSKIVLTNCEKNLL